MRMNELIYAPRNTAHAQARVALIVISITELGVLVSSPCFECHLLPEATGWAAFLATQIRSSPPPTAPTRQPSNPVKTAAHTIAHRREKTQLRTVTVSFQLPDEERVSEPAL